MSSKVPKREPPKMNSKFGASKRNSNEPQQVQAQVFRKKQASSHRVISLDAYFRLLAQIEALLQKLRVRVPVHFAQFDLNPPQADVEDLLLALQACLVPLVVAQRDHRKLDQHAEYPLHAEYARHFRQFLAQIPSGLPHADTAKQALSFALGKLEAGTFDEPMPADIARSILGEEEAAEHIRAVAASGGAGRLARVMADAHVIAAKCEASIEAASQSGRKEFAFGEAPPPLAIRATVHDVVAKRFASDEFL